MKIDGGLTFMNDCNFAKIMKKLAQKKYTCEFICWYHLWPNFRTLKINISGNAYDEPTDIKALKNNTCTVAHCIAIMLCKIFK